MIIESVFPFPLQHFVGHCNCATDIKEAAFLGQNDELVACGSDDGRVFIYSSVGCSARFEPPCADTLWPRQNGELAACGSDDGHVSIYSSASRTYVQISLGLIGNWMH